MRVEAPAQVPVEAPAEGSGACSGAVFVLLLVRSRNDPFGREKDTSPPYMVTLTLRRAGAAKSPVLPDSHPLVFLSIS